MSPQCLYFIHLPVGGANSQISHNCCNWKFGTRCENTSNHSIHKHSWFIDYLYQAVGTQLSISCLEETRHNKHQAQILSAIVKIPFLSSQWAVYKYDGGFFFPLTSCGSSARQLHMAFLMMQAPRETFISKGNALQAHFYAQNIA